jgi:hypothetical protein
MASEGLPTTFKKLIVKQYTNTFREGVEVVVTPLVAPGPGQVLVKSKYAGINASDVNWVAGRYTPGIPVPIDSGLEGLGEVVAVGPDCQYLKPGQAVAHLEKRSFGEYLVLDEKSAIPVPSAKAEYVPLLISGLTAAISLDKVADLKPKDVVLVTAAAGGLGQFAIQWAKNVGCHVIGVTSSLEKVSFIRSLGCDRAIDYNAENLAAVLKAEYPKGVDVVYETIGGETFQTCLGALTTKGRLLTIGMISSYTGENLGETFTIQTSQLIGSLILRSLSVRGFFLPDYAADIPEYIGKLVKLYDEGKLKSLVDLGENDPTGKFKGVESVPRAVEYMFARKNLGKVVVEL